MTNALNQYTATTVPNQSQLFYYDADGNLTRTGGTVPADFDVDADVDLVDFGVLQGCFNGPNKPPKAGCTNVATNLDGDVPPGTAPYGDVDLADQIIFQSCFNGPNRPPKSGCYTGPAPAVYVWDAENRLKSVEPTAVGEGATRVVFDYDYMNRRVRKQVLVYSWNGGTEQWDQTTTLDERFVYDQWNVVLVLNGLNSNATQQKYTWGLDNGDRHLFP